MGSTCSNILFHVVFSTKDRSPLISKELAPRLYDYMGGIANRHGGVLRTAGGMPDHVHLLLSVKSDVSAAEIVRFIKTVSSKWIHETFPEHASFAWQNGYAVFSVSQSRATSVAAYIRRQETHHRKTSFKEEFLGFLKKHGVEYDERYVFK